MMICPEKWATVIVNGRRWIFVGRMRSALVGTDEIWANEAAELRLAHEIFGTPIDRNTKFTEPEGVFGLFIGLWPTANILNVWLDTGDLA